MENHQVSDTDYFICKYSKAYWSINPVFPLANIFLFSEYPAIITEPTNVNQVRNKHGYRILDFPKISKLLKHGHNLLNPDNELVSGE